MSRYLNEIPVNVDPNVFTQGITQYMQMEGFALTTYNGQQVWKKGMGLLTAPQYMMILYSAGTVRIEAFIKFAILPGVYLGEMGTAGAFGLIPKKMLAERVKTVENYIRTAWEGKA